MSGEVFLGLGLKRDEHDFSGTKLENEVFLDLVVNMLEKEGDRLN